MSTLWATVKGVGRLFKVVVVLIGSLLGIVFITVAFAYFYFARDLPNIQTVSDYHPQLVSVVYGSDGTQIGEFWADERRHLIQITDVPKKVIQAFIAAEDARFWEHKGIDFRGIARAMVANFKAGEIVQGGSTITQQVTRSLLLSRQQTYARKVKEAILANRLERYLTKDQILYLYLNQIYFGNRAYGIKAAAENYFHKRLDELNLAEISMLAAVPRAPELYSPFRHPDRVRERQLYVLDRLVAERVITPQEKETALQTKVKVYKQGTDKDSNIRVAPHFLEFLRTQLLEKYGEEKLYYGALRLYTTINPKMQTAANEALRRGLEAVDRRRGGWRGVLEHVAADGVNTKKDELHLRILKQRPFAIFPPEAEPKETPTPIEAGEIYPAVVTGFKGQETLISAGRQSGSIARVDISFDQTKLAYDENLYLYNPPGTLKIGDVIRVRAKENSKFSFYQEPLIQGALYAQEPRTGFARAIVGGYDFMSKARNGEFNRALDALRQPGSAFKPFVYAAALDKGYTMDTQILDTPFIIPVGRETWAPKNYDGHYRGPTTLHNALIHSYNVAAARTAYHVGLDYIAAYQRKMGITTPIGRYPSMALGANGLHLHELVAAYATFPNLGVYHPPVFLLKVVDQEGNALEEYHAPAMPAAAAAPSPENLNTALYEANKNFIETERFNLSPSELRVLYGENIPPGHVVTPQTAYLMVKLMSDVVESGTGVRVRKLGKPVGGKTGTTNDTTDTWFVGYVPDLAAGAWVGYDAVRSIGSGEQGGRTAAPIFLDFMQQVTQDWEAKPFAMPESLKGKNIFKLAGGSAIHAETTPMPVFGGLFEEGGSSADRAADFMGADIEASPGEF